MDRYMMISQDCHAGGILAWVVCLGMALARVYPVGEPVFPTENTQIDRLPASV